MSISRIQVAGNANATSETINVTVSASAGDLIIVWGSTGGNSVSTFTISDDKAGGSNSYTAVTGYANVDLSGGNHAETDWFGYTVSTGTVTTVTVAHNAAGSSTFASVGVYRSDGSFSSPLDKNPGQGTYTSGTGPFSSGSSGVLSQASEVAIGFAQMNNDPGSITPAGGFTGRNTSAFLDGREHYFADQIVSATTALTFSFTTGNSVDSCANIVTFKDVAAASTFQPDEDYFINMWSKR